MFFLQQIQPGNRPRSPQVWNLGHLYHGGSYGLNMVIVIVTFSRPNSAVKIKQQSNQWFIPWLINVICLPHVYVGKTIPTSPWSPFFWAVSLPFPLMCDLSLFYPHETAFFSNWVHPKSLILWGISSINHPFLVYHHLKRTPHIPCMYYSDISTFPTGGCVLRRPARSVTKRSSNCLGQWVFSAVIHGLGRFHGFVAAYYRKGPPWDSVQLVYVCSRSLRFMIDAPIDNYGSLILTDTFNNVHVNIQNNIKCKQY